MEIVYGWIVGKVTRHQETLILSGSANLNSKEPTPYHSIGELIVPELYVGSSRKK
jgi:hypothetical protein